MPRREGDDIGADVSLDPKLAKEVEVVPRGSPVAPTQPERLEDQLDQPVQRRRRRIEVPGAWVWILKHDRSSRTGKTDVRASGQERRSCKRDLALLSPESCGDQDAQVRLGAATVGEPDQVRDQWRVCPVAAPVRGVAREFKKRLDITR